MKRIIYILSSVVFAAVLTACSDEWDSHYSQDKQTVNNVDVTAVESTISEYLKSETTLSRMYDLLNEAGIVEDMNQRDQLFTLFVVNNTSSTEVDEAVYTKDYLAKSHVSSISFSPANMVNGQRMLMWNGKYVNIAVDGNGDISFNGSKMVKVIKTTNGYIYEVDSFVEIPKSMYEIIEGLDDDYSLFREMVFSRNQKTFDKDASIAIGIDKTGSTEYDSVFIVTNPYFEAQDFNLTSESLTATMLIPSNEVINRTLSEAKANLKAWGFERADSVLNNWIFQAAFFNTEYSKQDFIDNEDLTSVFKKIWRTTVQEVDTDNPMTMSNGVAYYVKSMRIPTNVLIYRIKDYMKWYENLTDVDKDIYFDIENLTFDSMKTEVEPWSGWPEAGFPQITNRVVNFKLTDSSLTEFTMNFTPFRYVDNGDGTYKAEPYRIPPGEYDLCLGFKQSLKMNIEVYFNNKFASEVTQSNLSSATYHYDRGGQGYPEGYDSSKATNSKKGNYDRDGGKVGVVTISGTEAEQVLITFKGNTVTGSATFHHWCLKPTTNCY